jgi:hypothetical protein
MSLQTRHFSVSGSTSEEYSHPMPNKNQQSTLGELTEYKFDPKRPVPVPTPILSLKGVPLCTPGNISNIQGPAKSAKSAVMGAALAAMLRAITGKPMDENETLNFSSALPKNDETTRNIILHFDTEQSFYHHHRLCMDVLGRADIQEDEYATLPFRSYALLPMGYQDRKRMIEEALRHALDEQFRIACIFIDGVADIISDPNNADESFAIVDWLHSLAANPERTLETSSGRSTKSSERKFECMIVTILHENPGDRGKARGHLGSQIIRKSETNLRVRKGGLRGKDGKERDEHVSLIWVEQARGAHIPEKDGVKISWSKQHKRHLLHDPARQPENHEMEGKPPEAPRSANLTLREERTKTWLATILTRPLAHKELVRKVGTREKRKERTAKKRIKTWTKLGWIHKQPDAARAPYAFGPMPADPPDSPEPESAKPQAPKGSKKPGRKSAKAKQTENKGESKTATAAKTTADGGKPSKKQPKPTNPKTRNRPPRKAPAAKESKDKPASSTGTPGA